MEPLDELTAAARLLLDWGRLPYALTVSDAPCTAGPHATGDPASDLWAYLHSQGDTFEQHPYRDDEESVADVHAFLLGLAGQDPDERVLGMVDALACGLAAHHSTAHLVRDRRTVPDAAAAGHPPAAFAFTPTAPDTPTGLAPSERLRLEAALLAEHVWLDPSTPLRLDARVEPYGPADPSDDAAFRAWWPGSPVAAWFHDEYGCEDLPLERLDADGLAALRDRFRADCLRHALGCWWYGELVDEDAWDEDEPEFPGRRMVEALCAAVVDGVIAEAGADDGHAYRIGWSGDQVYGPCGALLFAGPERIGVLAVNASE